MSIGKLEAFVADYQREHLGGAPIPLLPEPSGFRVAVVGAGPAGMAVAEELAKSGHECTMYDAWPEPGGVLLYGIPNFKLSKRVLQDKLLYLDKLGVKFIGNTWVGRDITVEQMFEQGYDAVFVGTGASLGQYALGMDRAGDAEAELRLGVDDRVADGGLTRGETASGGTLDAVGGGLQGIQQAEVVGCLRVGQPQAGAQGVEGVENVHVGQSPLEEK